MYKIISTYIIVLIFAGISLHNTYAGPLTDEANKAIGEGYGNKVTSETQISTIVGSLINGALGLLGTVFLVLLVIAGYHWMTAAGNEEDITQAKARIWQAIMGLIIVMAALLITQFVLQWIKTATTP